MVYPPRVRHPGRRRRRSFHGQRRAENIPDKTLSTSTSPARTASPEQDRHLGFLMMALSAATLLCWARRHHWSMPRWALTCPSGLVGPAPVPPALAVLQSSISSQTACSSCSSQSAPGSAMAQLVQVPIGRAGVVRTLALTTMPGVSSTAEFSGAVVIPQCVGGSPGPTESEMPGASSALNHNASALADPCALHATASPPRGPPVPARAKSGPCRLSTNDSARSACHPPKDAGTFRSTGSR